MTFSSKIYGAQSTEKNWDVLGGYKQRAYVSFLKCILSMQDILTGMRKMQNKDQKVIIA